MTRRQPLRERHRWRPLAGLVLLGACSSASSSHFALEDAGDGGRGSVPDATMTLHEIDASLLGGGSGDPTTCAAAVAARSYVGCDYWPTVTANIVWEGFDFAAVVANPQSVTAHVLVTGPGGYSQEAVVAPGSLTKLYLPWVDALKGPGPTNGMDADLGFAASIAVKRGAYHLVSTVPVTVYQFNALEYKGVGGPPGKSWSDCWDETDAGCFSFTNDASLLIPSTAMTGNYRITGDQGSTAEEQGSVVAITATADGTSVTVTLSNSATVVASAAGDIPATSAGGALTLAMNAGDVVELVGSPVDGNDLSGSLVVASQPVQVISARQCANQPDPVYACDHLESSVMPAETWGKSYVVTVPTSPHKAVIGHKVRFFGNVDGTTLTYSPSQPEGCPSSLNAGDVIECAGTAGCATGSGPSPDGGTEPVSISCVTQSFEVTGSNAFAVSSFMLGGSAVDPGASVYDSEGDPSMSPMVATEQYRTSYIFLAPSDYDESYADVVLASGTQLTLDGAPLGASISPLNGAWSIARVELGGGKDGAHILTGTSRFGVQVIGYGAYTSYQYPAGLNLAMIAPPPPPPSQLK